MERSPLGGVCCLALFGLPSLLVGLIQGSRFSALSFLDAYVWWDGKRTPS